MIATASTPNEVALELTGRNYVSFSAISLYQRCPLAYRFKYLDNLPETVVSSSLVLGGAIHSAIEHHFNALMAGNPAPDLDTLRDVFWQAWRRRGEEATIQLGKGEDVNSISALAERILAEFLRSDLATPRGRILGVEEELHGEIIPGVPDLLARIDLLVESDEILTVTDLKTARSRWSASQAEDAGEQLLLYSELARQLAPHKHLRLEFAVITKAVKPIAERLPVTLDPLRVARTKQVVGHIWRAIQAGHFFPSPSPMNCPSCPFREPCRAWPG